MKLLPGGTNIRGVKILRYTGFGAAANHLDFPYVGHPGFRRREPGARPLSFMVQVETMAVNHRGLPTLIMLVHRRKPVPITSLRPPSYRPVTFLLKYISIQAGRILKRWAAGPKMLKDTDEAYKLDDTYI